MRQALILGGVPRLNEGREFPRVPLGPGNWRIEVEGRVGTALRLTTYKRVPGNHGTYEAPAVYDVDVHGKVLEGPIDACMSIITAGSEPSINAFAVSL